MNYIPWPAKTAYSTSGNDKTHCLGTGCYLFNGQVPESFSSSGNILFEGVIYNRKELTDYLKFSYCESISDGEILSSGFKEHGNDFFKKVNGSFIFLNADEHSGTLTIVTGCCAIENPSLFYWVNTEHIVFSSRLKKLLEFPGIPTTADDLQIASILNCLPRAADSTCFKHIKRLPPGHILTYNGSLQITRYWKLDDIKEIRFKTDIEYTECFLELYRDAVRNRIGDSKKTGIMLSCGLDSGTAAIFAAEMLAERGEELYSYTSIPVYDTESFLGKSRFGDESRFIKLLCEKYPAIHSKYLDSKNISPIDGIIKSLEMVCQPMHAAANMFWLQDICINAMNDNIQTLLMGQLGNMTVSYSGLKNNSKGLLDLIKNYNYCRLYYEKNIIKMYLKIFAPEIVLNVVKKLMSPGIYGDWKNFSAINPEFAEKLEIAEIQPFSEENCKQKNDRYKMFESLFRGIGTGFFGCAEIEFGFNILDPTADKKLVEFCFGIPDDQYQRYGITRFLIRRAFNNKMPKEILWNKMKGQQAADISLRVRDEYSRINNILRRFRKSDAVCEVLDISKMSGILNRTLTEKTPIIADQISVIFLRGLMVGLFLLKQEGDNNQY